MAPKVDQELVSRIVELHAAGLTNTEIARRAGCKRQYADYHLARLGLQSNYASGALALTPHSGFFDVIDAWPKAYCLGFIAADGCVTGDALEVFIKASDRAVLEYIQSCLESRLQIELRNGGRHARFRPAGAALVRTLARHGITERKSLTLSWPTTVPPHLLWPFILGYFDGDGTVGLYAIQRRAPSGTAYRSMRPSVAVCCSWAFADGLREFLSSQGVQTGVCDGAAGGMIARVFACSFVRACRWLRAMYAGAEFCLERKRLTAQAILDHQDVSGKAGR